MRMYIGGRKEKRTEGAHPHCMHKVVRNNINTTNNSKQLRQQ